MSSPRPGRRTAVGADVGGTAVKLGLVGEDGEVLDSDQLPTDFGAGEDLIEAVADRIVPWSDAADPPAGIGLGVAGLIDLDEGVVRSSPNLQFLDGFRVLEAARRRLSLPVSLANDANAAGLAEARFGALRGVDVGVCLMLGTGVGGAIIHRGRVWSGHSGYAGELGHIIVEPEGLACPCGGHGCLETEVAADAIVRRYRQASGSDEDIEAVEVSRRADQGDAAARAALAACGRYLGIGLAILVNLLNPQRIAIGGGVAGAGDWLLGPAADEAARRAWREVWKDCELVAAELGAEAGVVGAACLVWSD